MTIVYDRGVHKLKISFCACLLWETDIMQLIQARLWPSTWMQLRTAFTFNILTHFYQLFTQCNITTNNFFNYLMSITNWDLSDDVTVRMFACTGLLDITIVWQDCAREFLTAAREFNFVAACKCHGMQPIVNLPRGALMTKFPACPQISINIDPK